MLIYQSDSQFGCAGQYLVCSIKSFGRHDGSDRIPEPLAALSFVLAALVTMIALALTVY